MTGDCPITPRGIRYLIGRPGQSIWGDISWENANRYLEQLSSASNWNLGPDRLDFIRDMMYIGGDFPIPDECDVDPKTFLEVLRTLVKHQWIRRRDDGMYEPDPSRGFVDRIREISSSEYHHGWLVADYRADIKDKELEVVDAALGIMTECAEVLDLVFSHGIDLPDWKFEELSELTDHMDWRDDLSSWFLARRGHVQLQRRALWYERPDLYSQFLAETMDSLEKIRGQLEPESIQMTGADVDRNRWYMLGFRNETVYQRYLALIKRMHHESGLFDSEED